jgi:hypothetical protein
VKSLQAELAEAYALIFRRSRKGSKTQRKRIDKMQWFKIHAQRWFLGSTRFELSPEQRSVWIDTLARASLNDPPGEFSYYSLDQLAVQFQVPIELLKISLKRFIKVQKIKHNGKEKFIKISNWAKYQSEYERQKPYRKGKSPQESHCNKVTPKVVTKLPLEERRGEEEKIREEVEGEEREIKEGEISTSKLQFFKLLRSFPSYPFQEEEDSSVFDHLKGRIDIIKQTKRKILWWQKNPQALLSKKKSPRQQLIEFFLEEVEFQNQNQK